nr:MAG TPA: Paratox [Caudoviricetes sp.]
MKRFMLVKCLMKEACDMYIYRRYITKNGVRIYPKNGKVFRFWVDDEVEAV